MKTTLKFYILAVFIIANLYLFCTNAVKIFWLLMDNINISTALILLCIGIAALIVRSLYKIGGHDYT